MGLTRSIIGGGGGFGEVVPEGGGVLRGGYEGGIGGVGSIGDGCEEPWMASSHEGGGEGVLAMGKVQRRGGELWLGARSPPLMFSGG